MGEARERLAITGAIKNVFAELALELAREKGMQGGVLDLADFKVVTEQIDGINADIGAGRSENFRDAVQQPFAIVEAFGAMERGKERVQFGRGCEVQLFKPVVVLKGGHVLLPVHCCDRGKSSTTRKSCKGKMQEN